MGKRILFVPFDVMHNAPGGAGHDYIGKNNSWIRSYDAKQTARLAVQDDAEVHDILQVYYSYTPGQSSLRGLGADDQIYVRGHCVVGYPGVFDHSNTDDQGRDTYRNRDQQLYQLLQADGSRVSVHKAHLRAPEVAKRLRDMGLDQNFNGKIKCYNCHSAEGSPNFATELSNELALLGYNSCGVYGYTGALSSMYSGAHKDSTSGGRASENRIEIRAPA